jgi:hypothetical protein
MWRNKQKIEIFVGITFARGDQGRHWTEAQFCIASRNQSAGKHFFFKFDFFKANCYFLIIASRKKEKDSFKLSDNILNILS